jgi:hypothetical protein
MSVLEFFFFFCARTVQSIFVWNFNSLVVPQSGSHDTWQCDSAAYCGPIMHLKWSVYTITWPFDLTSFVKTFRNLALLPFIIIVQRFFPILKKNQQNEHISQSWFNSIIVSSTCFEQLSVHHEEDLYTLFNKNQAAWYFVRPAQAWRTISIIIRVFYFPHICASGAFLCLTFITNNYVSYILTKDTNILA